MTDAKQPGFDDLNSRTREVFQRIVESYLETGEPVGSRTLSRNLTEKVSAATVRNVMQDLEYLGLLEAPHVSAGRVPTQTGLRLFVDGFMEMRGLEGEERKQIEKSVSGDHGDMGKILDRAGNILSSLTSGASLVLAPSTQAPIKHIEFVSLSPDRALVVLVTADGHVENRLFTPPMGLTPSDMRVAANFLNAVLEGRTLSEASDVVSAQIKIHRRELDDAATRLIDAGVAVWSEENDVENRLIVRGASHLLDSATQQDLDLVRQLMDDIERKRDLVQLLDLSQAGDGVRVFIGSENKLFSLSGSSLVVSPYMNAENKIIGAIGVIGPTRLNYGRIVPIVDYTAQLVGRLVSDRS